MLVLYSARAYSVILLCGHSRASVVDSEFCLRFGFGTAWYTSSETSAGSHFRAAGGRFLWMTAGQICGPSPFVCR